MSTTDTSFDALHPRTRGGQFAEKENTAPAAALPSHMVAVAPYAGEPIAERSTMPSAPSERSMVLGDEQAGQVWTFAEEHRLEDGRYLSSVQYIYHAYAGEGQMSVVTETEQFVSEASGEYDRTAHQVREGSTWHRYDSAPVTCSVERAASMAKRSAEDAHLHQSYFASTVPWTGEPLAETAEAFRDASARLNS